MCFLSWSFLLVLCGQCGHCCVACLPHSSFIWRRMFFSMEYDLRQWGHEYSFDSFHASSSESQKTKIKLEKLQIRVIMSKRKCKPKRGGNMRSWKSRFFSVKVNCQVATYPSMKVQIALYYTDQNRIFYSFNGETMEVEMFQH